MNFFFNKNKPPAKQQCDLKENAAPGFGNNGDGKRRPMKFPYTFSAKMAQFPYKYYFQNNWIYRYHVYGIIVSIPVFMYLSSLANSPGNVAKWAEIKRKEEEEYRHKFA